MEFMQSSELRVWRRQMINILRHHRNIRLLWLPYIYLVQSIPETHSLTTLLNKRWGLQWLNVANKLYRELLIIIFFIKYIHPQREMDLRARPSERSKRAGTTYLPLPSLTIALFKLYYYHSPSPLPLPSTQT